MTLLLVLFVCDSWIPIRPVTTFDTILVQIWLVAHYDPWLVDCARNGTDYAPVHVDFVGKFPNVDDIVSAVWNCTLAVVWVFCWRTDDDLTNDVQPIVLRESCMPSELVKELPRLPQTLLPPRWWSWWSW